MRIRVACNNCTAILAHRWDSCGCRTFWYEYGLNGVNIFVLCYIRVGHRKHSKTTVGFMVDNAELGQVSLQALPLFLLTVSFHRSSVLIFILMLRTSKNKRANPGTFKDILLKISGSNGQRGSSAMLHWHLYWVLFDSNTAPVDISVGFCLTVIQRVLTPLLGPVWQYHIAYLHLCWVPFDSNTAPVDISVGFCLTVTQRLLTPLSGPVWQ
jgi:hypothetical protein